MIKETTSVDQAEREILDCEIADEALEAMAMPERSRVAFTLGACTGLSVCDG